MKKKLLLFLLLVSFLGISCQAIDDPKSILESYFDEVLGEYVRPDILFFEKGNFIGTSYDEYVVILGEEDVVYAQNSIDNIYIVALSKSGKVKEIYSSDVISAGYSERHYKRIKNYSTKSNDFFGCLYKVDLTGDEKDDILVLTTSGMGTSIEVLTIQNGKIMRVFSDERIGGSSITDLEIVDDPEHEGEKMICLKWPTVDTSGKGSVVYNESYYVWDQNQLKFLVEE